MIINNVLDLIGNTPLIRLESLEKELDLHSAIYFKLESVNLTGSIKARVAKEIILTNLKNGTINKKTLLLEATSGNTGIGVAAIAKTLGMNSIIALPESMSKERIDMLEAYGAKVVKTPKEEGMQGSVEYILNLHKEIKNSYIIDQFNNPLCVETHYKTTANEILEDLNNVDIFISGIGTGGTFTGVSKRLKEVNRKTICVGVEPASSPMLSLGKASAHKIQGIGANFVPSILDRSLLDEIVTVTDEDAYIYCKMLSKAGLFVGISSGAAFSAAVRIAKKEANKNIVVILPDDGNRYISTGVFND